MPKILKPYTIIPSELYVQRDADRQVKNIISDMGRPGYVLVSRQMGKTNLLLNAKRKLESESVFFVYIDLSNSFPNAKSCFENIIDTAIETYTEKFQAVSKVIFERRTELKDTPAHKQHTNELRLLLRTLEGGKMIVILDEIDALTKTDYSDQIFSQIRSSYFASRVNYSEFYNLTYLLSGVVEPNEIIKDSKISPFNIGQKIYLNDFSRVEFEDFLNKSKLNLHITLSDRIFYWTNGNPRMTWDVCSEVENRVKQSLLTSEAIDKIIFDLYLTTFDKPPIDNIREIVKNDREVRNSIIEIEKGKEVSDRIKSKLYLAGIINYDEDNIHIKNEIIRSSLSLDWVRELEEDDKGLIKLAIEEYQDLKYSESLSSFEKYLKNNEFIEGSDKSTYFFIMGHSAYSLQEFEKALACFNKVDFKIEDDPILYYKTLNYKGLTYYHLNMIEDSLECLKKVIANGKKDTIYAMALLNYGGISLKSDRSTRKVEATKIFEEIISETAFKKEMLKEDFISELKSIAHYYLAQIYKFSNDQFNAIENYKHSISFGKEITKPKIILALLEITNNNNDKHDLLNQLIELIANGKIKPQEEDSENPMNFSFDELRYIAIYAFINFRQTLFPKLKPHLFLLGDNLLSKHLYDLALFSVNKHNDWGSAIELLNEIYLSFSNAEYQVDKEIYYSTLKLLAYFTINKNSISKQIEYLSLFKIERLESVDEIDMEIFANTIHLLIEKKKYPEALGFVNFINSIKETVLETNLINYLVIYHLELNLYLHLKDNTKAISKAEEIVSFANGKFVDKQKSNLVDANGIEKIKQNAESILQQKNINRIPVRVEKTYERNNNVKVRYKDGTIIETKYKKVERDLETGACIILN